MTLKPWIVVSQEYGEVIPILDYGQGPMEYGCDVVNVWAETKREARVLGLKLFRQQGARFLDKCDCPFAEMKVLPGACEHGACMFDGEPDCQRCLAEMDACDTLLGVEA